MPRGAAKMFAAEKAKRKRPAAPLHSDKAARTRQNWSARRGAEGVTIAISRSNPTRKSNAALEDYMLICIILIL